MVTYVTNPFLLGKLELIPEMWLNIVSGTLLAIYVVDNIVSGVVIKAIKKADITASKETDNTEEITKKVREILQSKSALHRRLVDAFPKLQAVKIKIKDQTEKIKKEAIRQKEEIETKVEDTTKAIAEKVSNVSITGKKKKQIKEENETNVRSKSDECNTCNRATGIKETDDSFLRDFITRILITAILHL